jgi:hypothetical protein
MKTFFPVFIMFVLSTLSLGCDKKASADQAGVQARRDSATTICLDQAKQWCDRVKGIVTQLGCQEQLRDLSID